MELEFENIHYNRTKRAREGWRELEEGEKNDGKSNCKHQGNIRTDNGKS